MTFSLITIILLSYLLGSIPWAFIIVKVFYSEDLRKKGTGNIGAMNSYDITGKKWIGIAVFILDCFKGAGVILIARLLSNDNVIIISLAGFFVVLGHNFSVFMKFKGGRGLSSAVGVSLMINPLLIIIWTSLWVIEFMLIKRNVHIANAAATVLSPAFLIIIKENLIMKIMMIPNFSGEILFYLTIAICILILIRHVQPIYELIKK
ncbi:MAG: glycerol-3-phosphate acyltransferase [Bacteroidetes bacterium]|nr:glycerol-3-phosphate acyltransferase [Bacteroidota bacterium]